MEGKEKGILPMKNIKLTDDYKQLDMNTPAVAEDHVVSKQRHHR